MFPIFIYLFFLTEIFESVEVTICYDEVLTIDCSPNEERIEILTVDYGSYQVDVCPNTLKVLHPASQGESQFIVGDRCNNHDKCSFTVNKEIFGGFAGEDAKSLYVKYKCKLEVSSFPPRADTTLVACEGDTLNLDCGHYKISVIRASYGRNLGDYVCSATGDDTSTSPLTQDCTFKSASNKIITLCHGKNTCSISSDTAEFGGDECPKVRKYVSVSRKKTLDLYYTILSSMMTCT